MAVAGPRGAYGRCSEGGLTTCSTAVGDITLLLPGGWVVLSLCLLGPAERFKFSKLSLSPKLPQYMGTELTWSSAKAGEDPQPVALVLV